MKIDRDNFRHLTGFGRDMANYVACVVGELDKISEQILAGTVGNVIVHHRQDKNELSYRLMPFMDDDPTFVRDLSSVEKVIKGIQLGIIVDFEGFREVTALPMYMILSDQCRPHYHIYRHAFLDDRNGERIENAAYTGVTKRGWRTRWSEHLRAANSGSHYLFHKAIRQWNGVATSVLHQIIGHADSEQRAMDIEERLVERDSLHPKGLNMIPGGNAGLEYLRKLGALGKRERCSVDDRQAVINRFHRANPLAAANWLNAAYAESVICGAPGRLKPQQIRDARSFALLGIEADDIASRIGARNTAQVERLMSGQTYSRIL